MTYSCAVCEREGNLFGMIEHAPGCPVPLSYRNPVCRACGGRYETFVSAQPTGDVCPDCRERQERAARDAALARARSLAVPAPASAGVAGGGVGR